MVNDVASDIATSQVVFFFSLVLKKVIFSLGRKFQKVPISQATVHS